jgi:hypothetical protein
MQKASDALLSVLNIVLLREGGSISVPAEFVSDAPPRNVHMEVVPPDPDVAGSQAHYVLTLEGVEPKPPEVEPMPLPFLQRLGFMFPRR